MSDLSFTIIKLDPEKEKSRLDDVAEMMEWGFFSTHCHFCGKNNSELNGSLIQCARCKVTYYCGIICLEKDQARHSEFCLRPKPERRHVEEKSTMAWQESGIPYRPKGYIETPTFRQKVDPLSTACDSGEDKLSNDKNSTHIGEIDDLPEKNNNTPDDKVEFAPDNNEELKKQNNKNASLPRRQASEPDMLKQLTDPKINQSCDPAGPLVQTKFISVMMNEFKADVDDEPMNVDKIKQLAPPESRKVAEKEDDDNTLNNLTSDSGKLIQPTANTLPKQNESDVGKLNKFNENARAEKGLRQSRKIAVPDDLENLEKNGKSVGRLKKVDPRPEANDTRLSPKRLVLPGSFLCPNHGNVVGKLIIPGAFVCPQHGRSCTEARCVGDLMTPGAFANSKYRGKCSDESCVEDLCNKAFNPCRLHGSDCAKAECDSRLNIPGVFACVLHGSGCSEPRCVGKIAIPKIFVCPEHGPKCSRPRCIGKLIIPEIFVCPKHGPRCSEPRCVGKLVIPEIFCCPKHGPDCTDSDCADTCSENSTFVCPEHGSDCTETQCIGKLVIPPIFTCLDHGPGCVETMCVGKLVMPRVFLPIVSGDSCRRGRCVGKFEIIEGPIETTVKSTPRPVMKLPIPEIFAVPQTVNTDSVSSGSLKPVSTVRKLEIPNFFELSSNDNNTVKEPDVPIGKVEIPDFKEIIPVSPMRPTNKLILPEIFAKSNQFPIPTAFTLYTPISPRSNVKKQQRSEL